MKARIEIVKKGITELDVDCIVNAANEYLEYGGVCGAIFEAAGISELQTACAKYGKCQTGSAVITPGFRLKAKHVIHAVGPVWCGGGLGEPALLRSCDQESLRLAMEHECKTVAFPLISSGIYGYPKKLAWQEAITAICQCLDAHADSELRVIMSVLDEQMYQLGKDVLREMTV